MNHPLAKIERCFFVMIIVMQMMIHFSGGEPIGQGKDGAIHRGREDASHSLREGGHQPFVERGRTPAVHREREDASHSSREGGHQLYIERGRMPAIRQGREAAVR